MRRVSATSRAREMSSTTPKFSPARGNDVEPGDLDRGRRAGLVDGPPLVVEQGADAAEAVAADDHVADAEGPFLDQHGRHARRGLPRARPPGRCRWPGGSGRP